MLCRWVNGDFPCDEQQYDDDIWLHLRAWLCDLKVGVSQTWPFFRKIFDPRNWLIYQMLDISWLINEHLLYWIIKFDIKKNNWLPEI